MKRRKSESAKKFEKKNCRKQKGSRPRTARRGGMSGDQHRSCRTHASTFNCGVAGDNRDRRNKDRTTSKRHLLNSHRMRTFLVEQNPPKTLSTETCTAVLLAAKSRMNKCKKKNKTLRNKQERLHKEVQTTTRVTHSESLSLIQHDAHTFEKIKLTHIWQKKKKVKRSRAKA